MICESFVYRFLNEKDEVIYVGKATNIVNRLRGHNHLPERCYRQVKKIEILGFPAEFDCDFAELYFIQKYDPFYNTQHGGKYLSFPVPFLDEIKWTLFEEANILKVIKYGDKKSIEYYQINGEYHQEPSVFNLLMKDPSMIKRMKKPTEKMIETVLQRDGSLVEYLINKFPKKINQNLCKIAFNTYFGAIRYIKEPSIEDCLAAVKSDHSLIDFIEHKTDEMYEEVLKKNIEFIHKIENPTDRMIEIVLEEDGNMLQHIKEIKHYQALLAVTQNGLALRWVSKEMQKGCVIPEAAIKQNPAAIKYSKYINKNIIHILLDTAPELLIYTGFERWGTEIILKVLAKRGRLLKYVDKDNQTLEMCEIAVKQDPIALKYAKFKTQDMCENAVRMDASIFRYVPDEYRFKKLYEEVIEANPQNTKNIPKNQLEYWMYWKALKLDYTIFYSVNCENVRTREVLSYVFKREPDIGKFFSHLNQWEIEELSDEIIRKCLSYNCLWINRFKNQLKDYCLFAISQNILAVPFINKLTPNCYIKIYNLIKEECTFTEENCAFLKKEFRNSREKNEYRYKWFKILREIKIKFVENGNNLDNLWKFERNLDRVLDKI